MNFRILTLLAMLPPLFWSGNFIVGRIIRDSIPPITFSFWRWFVSILIVTAFALPGVIRQWPIIRRNLPLVTLLAILSVGCFNTFVYIGLQHTTATNATLLLSITPLIIICLDFILYQQPLRRLQVLGLAITFLGVLTIISKADYLLLIALTFNTGDLWVLLAVCSWSLYSVLLRKQPIDLAPMTFLWLTVFIGLIVITPFYLWERYNLNYSLQYSKENLLAIGYVAIFASLLAFYIWNHIVARMGASKAGFYIHLIPVFAVVQSYTILQERLYLFHGIGVILIITGILLSQNTGFATSTSPKRPQ